MPSPEPELTPEERFREVASILAAGLLRLSLEGGVRSPEKDGRTRRAPTDSRLRTPDFGKNSLDAGRPRLPHLLGSSEGGVWSPEDNGCPGTPPDSGLKTPGS
jgi:hypothetical protein